MQKEHDDVRFQEAVQDAIAKRQGEVMMNHTPMEVMLDEEVTKLREQNAELLEALENIAERLNSRLWDDEDLIASTKAVATEAIRKAGR